MSNRWSEQDEDSARLPEGFKRIGYDTDTQRYTFHDENGQLYEGEPGVRYGVMKPIPSPVDVVKRTRPSAFARSHVRSSTLPAKLDRKKSPQTFQDFVPPELITSSPISETPTSKSTSKPSNSKPFPVVDLFRKSTMPKMQGVVNGLRRSVTSIRRSRLRPQGQDQEGGAGNEKESGAIFRRGSTLSTATAPASNSNSVSALDRSTSVSTSQTDGSQQSVIPVHPVQQS